MKTNRRHFLSAVLLLVLCMAMALPVCAAKPKKSSSGILCITTSGEDLQYHMAVCVEEEDGNYVYCGSHPIQQQVGLYVSVTNSSETNNFYKLEEDTTYDAVKGVYRFELGEKAKNGSEADLFPKMAAVSKDETVYFVHLDMDESEVFVTEKTTVASIKQGVLTTKDGLEKESENGDFSVIFNDSGDVVGFCKSGVASVPGSKDTGISPLGILVISVVVLAGIGAGAGVMLAKKRKEPVPADNSLDTNTQQWEGQATTLEDATQLDSDDFPASPGYTPILICHGGYLNGRVYPIGPDGITIGREPDNSIRYPAQTPGISRHHVRIFWQNGQLTLLDLGSSNGTYLNQTGRIASMRPVPLKVGDFFYLAEKLNAFEIACK